MNIPTLFLTVATLACMSVGVRAEVCNSITNEVVKVDAANDEWTPAAIKIKPGDLLLVIATGITHNPNVFGSKDATAKSEGWGGLTMKYGTGTVIPVGDRWVGAFREPGSIKFHVNGGRIKGGAMSNAGVQGSYDVHVIVIPAGTLPPSVKVDNQ